MTHRSFDSGDNQRNEERHGFDFKRHVYEDHIYKKGPKETNDELKKAIQDFNDHLNDFEESEPMKPHWTTADGRVILIREMEDDHLYNVFKFLCLTNRMSIHVLNEMARRHLLVVAGTELKARPGFQYPGEIPSGELR